MTGPQREGETIAGTVMEPKPADGNASLELPGLSAVSDCDIGWLDRTSKDYSRVSRSAWTRIRDNCRSLIRRMSKETHTLSCTVSEMGSITENRSSQWVQMVLARLVPNRSSNESSHGSWSSWRRTGTTAVRRVAATIRLLEEAVLAMGTHRTKVRRPASTTEAL